MSEFSKRIVKVELEFFGSEMSHLSDRNPINLSMLRDRDFMEEQFNDLISGFSDFELKYYLAKSIFRLETKSVNNLFDIFLKNMTDEEVIINSFFTSIEVHED